MQPFSRIIEQSNEAGIGFLMVELDAGLTFMGVAETTASSETAARNRDHAHLAYVTILRYVDRVRFDDDNKAEFEQKFAELKDQLAEAGYPV